MRRSLHCLECDRPWVISHRCREHHYKLRGHPWPDDGKPLVSMSVKWMRKRMERPRAEALPDGRRYVPAAERVNAELNAQG